MSRIASDEPELPWEFNEAVPDAEQDAPVVRAQSFRWRDHPGKIVLAAPFLAAILTVSTWAVVPVAASWGIIPATAKETITFAAFITNWGLAIVGAACSGILLRESANERVEFAVAACVVSAVGYILTLIVLAIVMLCVSAFVGILFFAVVYLIGSS